jgi:hypothetical protein
MNWTYWANRFGHLLLLAALAAPVFAGLGALMMPATARMAGMLACPPGTMLSQDIEAIFDLICLDSQGTMFQIGWRAFLIECVFYFVVCGGVMILASFAIDRFARRGRRLRAPVGHGPP